MIQQVRSGPALHLLSAVIVTPWYTQSAARALRMKARLLWFVPAVYMIAQSLRHCSSE